MMGWTMEHCDGCSKEFTHRDEAYLFNDMGIVLCPECMVEVKGRLKAQGKLDLVELLEKNEPTAIDDDLWSGWKYSLERLKSQISKGAK